MFYEHECKTLLERIKMDQDKYFKYAHKYNQYVNDIFFLWARNILLEEAPNEKGCNTCTLEVYKECPKGTKL